MDNFYMSAITPFFFVECLADLEKQMKSGSTPEQLASIESATKFHCGPCRTEAAFSDMCPGGR